MQYDRPKLKKLLFKSSNDLALGSTICRTIEKASNRSSFFQRPFSRKSFTGCFERFKPEQAEIVNGQLTNWLFKKTNKIRSGLSSGAPGSTKWQYHNGSSALIKKPWIVFIQIAQRMKWPAVVPRPLTASCAARRKQFKFAGVRMCLRCRHNERAAQVDHFSTKSYALVSTWLRYRTARMSPKTFHIAMVGRNADSAALYSSQQGLRSLYTVESTGCLRIDQIQWVSNFEIQMGTPTWCTVQRALVDCRQV